jgi:hypothetical protein
MMGRFEIIPGGDLLSRTVTHKVTVRLPGLTHLFGMGTGVRFFLIERQAIFFDLAWLLQRRRSAYSRASICA